MRATLLLSSRTPGLNCCTLDAIVIEVKAAITCQQEKDVTNLVGMSTIDHTGNLRSANVTFATISRISLSLVTPKQRRK